MFRGLQLKVGFLDNCRAILHVTVRVGNGRMILHFSLQNITSSPLCHQPLLFVWDIFRGQVFCSFRTTALLMCTGHHVDLNNFSEEQNLASFSLTGHLYSFQELAIQGLCTFLNLIVYFLVIDL